MNNIKIDFVLPWVDPSDQMWQQKKLKYSGQALESDGNSESRFRDLDTLRFVLRSIEKNCPWYNKIFLITEGHIPKWLDINTKQVVVVSHDEMYINKDHLPVFNSSSIEMNLSNIKGLSEHFVYLNDDTIIWKKIEQTRFFNEGLPVDFLKHGWLKRGELFKLLRGEDTWVNSIKNNIYLVRNVYGKSNISSNSLFNKSYGILGNLSNFLLKYVYSDYFWFEHWHHPQPYCRRTFTQVRSLFSEEMNISSKNKFRMNNDLTHYLNRYWHLVNNDFFPFFHNDGLEANISSIKQLKRLLNKVDNYNFVCFNDSPALADKDFLDVKAELSDLLEKRFYEKASFEL
ncbi:Stealth CR1 domain-containing protein [Myroides sp. LJL119]